MRWHGGDRKLKFNVLDKADKVKFIGKVVSYQLDRYSLPELPINRFVLRDKVESFIENRLIQHAKIINFEELCRGS